MEGKTLICFVLDETGSMESIKSDTIGGFNSYLETLAQANLPVEFTLIKFDSNHVEKVCVGVPLSEVPRLTPETYRPGAMTPLIDATYKAITATAVLAALRQDAPQVLLVVQTDGEENCSTEHTLAELALLIKEKQTAGWQFLFLGAGIDAFQQADSMGISGLNTLSYARANTGATFAAVGDNTVRYMCSGDAGSLAFSAAQRAASGANAAAPSSLPSSPSSPGVPPHGGQRSPSTAAARPPIVDDFSLVEAEGLEDE